jgi:hypothetical protein
VKGKDLRLQGGTGPKTGGYQADGATKRELIVAATMIARMVITSAFSDRTEFSVTTESVWGFRILAPASYWCACSPKFDASIPRGQRRLRYLQRELHHKHYVKPSGIAPKLRPLLHSYFSELVLVLKTRTLGLKGVNRGLRTFQAYRHRGLHNRRSSGPKVCSAILGARI